MGELIAVDDAYRTWIADLKSCYRQLQIRAAVSVNGALMEFYWRLGKDIRERYVGTAYYGSRFFVTLSRDLQSELQNASGLSPINLRYCQRFYELYFEQPNLPQVVEILIKVPWGHHRFIIDRCGGNSAKALFYVQKTLEHGWSRNALLNHLDTNLFERYGRGINNFALTMPPNDSDLIRETIRDPYHFAFAEIAETAQERDIERALISHISETLMELGQGFAYVGHQVRFQVGEREFYPDLIFYHLGLRRYLVIELKVGEFQPENLSQLRFYMTAVDNQLKHEWDGQTIGLLLCKERDAVVAKYALQGESAPIGIARYTTRRLPVEFRDMVQSVEQVCNTVRERFFDGDKKMQPGDFTCDISGAKARGRISDSGFIVATGSRVSVRVTSSLRNHTPSYYRLRKQLEAEGVIVDRIFVRDYEFASPSAASSVVSGRPSNGRLDWKTAEGRCLKEVQEEWRT